MTRCRYLVYVQRQFRGTYVTTQRNTEDMINVLRDIYEDYRDIKIKRVCNGVTELVYKTGDDKHFKTEDDEQTFIRAIW